MGESRRRRDFGANLYVDQHIHLRPLLEFTLVKSADSLNMSTQSPSEVPPLAGFTRGCLCNCKVYLTHQKNNYPKQLREEFAVHRKRLEELNKEDQSDG